MTPPSADPSADDLQARLVAFVRAFGLHQPDETPCGSPVPVSEAHALWVLADRGPLTQTDLVHHLSLGKSTVSRLVDQLVARGWAERRTSEQDARCRLVQLTPDGARTAAGLARSRAARFARLLDRIPAADRPAVLAALDTLAEAAREP
ncbi:MAG TPA: MarR family transcriptional regulator [Acidimicrobiales bacterium]|nr:MarR family transcriptional regulator [Acidimicrobiales bacterium]